MANADIMVALIGKTLPASLLHGRRLFAFVDTPLHGAPTMAVGLIIQPNPKFSTT